MNLRTLKTGPKSFHDGFSAVSKLLVRALFVGLMLLAGPFEITSRDTAPAVASAASTLAIQAPDHIVIILMENHGINATYNCGGNCTYITQLADTYGLAESYSALTHPSLHNYIALTSGDLYGTNDTLRPGSLDVSNIVDSLEGAGKTWKAYMESYHGGCSDSGSNYSINHNPFVKYANIYNNPTRCARIINAGNDAGNSTASPLLSDLASESAPNYMWLTPNQCHNMHDCPVSVGDNYLASLIPKILNSYAFTTQDAALFLTFDEGCCSHVYPRDYVTTIWAGPGLKQGYKSVEFYDHYSLLRTIESFWNLPSLTTNDENATAMTEFFAPVSSPPVSFSLSNSGALSLVQGGSAYNLLTAALSSNPQSILPMSFTCDSGLPSNSSCSFSPPLSYSCGLVCSSTLKISTSPFTPAGSYEINITASYGVETNQTQVTLTVLPPLQLGGDVNRDCTVNIFDLARVARFMGNTIHPGIDPRTDQNLDSRVDITDLILVAANIGKACP